MRTNSFPALCAFVFVLLGSTGCARFEYRLLEPATLAQPISREGSRIPYEPLEYFLIDFRDHLGIKIRNPTDVPITLVGDRSYVVSPRGETHPIPSTAIAPRSYIDFFLPPLPMRAEAYGGSRFSFGLGFGHFGRPRYYSRFGYGFAYDPFYDPFFYEPPRYYRIVTPYDWTWREGQVRMRLVYTHQDQTFDHDFLFLRERVR